MLWKWYQNFDIFTKFVSHNWRDTQGHWGWLTLNRCLFCDTDQEYHFVKGWFNLSSDQSPNMGWLSIFNEGISLAMYEMKYGYLLSVLNGLLFRITLTRSPTPSVYVWYVMQGVLANFAKTIFLWFGANINLCFVVIRFVHFNFAGGCYMNFFL